MPHAIQIRQTSGPEALNWTAVDVGEPGSGQPRLRQAAAGLNYMTFITAPDITRSRFQPPVPSIPLRPFCFRRRVRCL